MSTARARLGSGRSSLREGLGALRYVPTLFRQVWRTSRVLTVATVSIRAVRAILPVLILYVAKLIIDEIVLQTSAPRADADFRDWLAAGRLTRLVWLFSVELALAVALDLLGRLGALVDALLAELYVNEISVELMQHASSLDLEQFESSEHQDRIERARRQASGRSSLLAQILTQAQDLLTVIGFSIGLAAYAPWLILLLLFALLPACLGEAHFNARAYSLNFAKTPERRELDYLRYIGASVETARENRIFGLSGFLIGRFRRLARAIYVANRSLAIQRASWGGLFAGIALAAYYAAYAVIAWRTLTGQLTIGDLTFLAGSLLRLRSLLEGLLLGFSQLAGQALYLGDLFSFFTIRPQIVSREHPRAFPSPPREGFLFEDVSFRYPGAERWLIRHLSFAFRAGEVLALVGENGAGKTTLAKLLARLYDPDEGRILLDGHDLREYDIAELHARIGVIFQDFVRFHFTAGENIAIGRVDARAEQDRIVSAAESSRADEIIARLPHGYAQPLGKRFRNGVELSGGEWQKIALARAYMRDADVLILDEPTAALDARAEYEVFNRFKELSRGKSTILISHRFSTVRMADRIMVLHDGRVEELGSHDELMRSGGRYAELFKLQAAGYQ
jgi:ATP-binding cassette subfamily B protein